MGNREDLLAGAKRCLLAKGYARTTARDIASASGVSLAAIGYHFGSKEALLNAALTGAVEEWADGFGQLSGQRFADVWPRVVESFAESKRLWAVQFELLAHMDSGQMDPACAPPWPRPTGRRAKDSSSCSATMSPTNGSAPSTRCCWPEPRRCGSSTPPASRPPTTCSPPCGPSPNSTRERRGGDPVAYHVSEMTDSVKSATRKPGKRERLVAAAARVLHEQGVEKTTLADIAQAAEIPVGNVYYYFKTKDQLIEAAIGAHAQHRTR